MKRILHIYKRICKEGRDQRLESRLVSLKCDSSHNWSLGWSCWREPSTSTWCGAGRSMRELTLSWLVSELKLLCGLLFTNIATWCCTFSSFRMSLLRYGSVTEDAYSSPDRTVVRQAFSQSFLWSIQKFHDRKASILCALPAAWYVWLLHDMSSLIVVIKYLVFVNLLSSLSFI